MKEKIYLSPIRELARKLGINRLFRPYGEEHIIEFISKHAIKDDVFWDVGAKVGMYSVLADRVGKIIAFEPEEKCFRQLSSNTSSLPNIRCFNLALGNENKKMKLKVAEGKKGTHTLLYDGKGKFEVVSVRKGDSLKIPKPNIIKIDVEGFEEEVLNGMRKTLKNPDCRIVVIEIHFSLLEMGAPKRIVEFLQSFGFNIKWLGRSHVAAFKAIKKGELEK